MDKRQILSLTIDTGVSLVITSPGITAGLPKIELTSVCVPAEGIRGSIPLFEGALVELTL
jgi:hypothetical protein